MSIFDEDGRLIYDSGDSMERMQEIAFPMMFNMDRMVQQFDKRSDDSGQEPEGLLIQVFIDNTNKLYQLLPIVFCVPFNSLYLYTMIISL